MAPYSEILSPPDMVGTDMVRKASRSESKLCMTSDYNSAIQAAAATRLTAFLRRAAASVEVTLPEGTPLVILEHGCSTGGSSIEPLQAIRDAVSKDRSLRVIMNDLPMNDWGVLKETVESKFPDMDFSYKPTSMYGPVATDGDVHIAYSCYAQHWICNGSPTGLPNGAIWANQLPHGNKYRATWEEESKQDWEILLKERAAEVATGGTMVFHIQSAMCCGALLEQYTYTLQKAKLAMMENGELSEDASRKLTLPEYMKTPSDILAPLVSGPMKLLWEVEEVHYQRIPCPLLEEYKASQNTDPQGMVDRMIRYIRSFMGPSIVECAGEAKANLFWKYVE